MKPQQSTLELMTRALADVLDPDPRPVYMADSARLWPSADAETYRRRTEAFCTARGIQPIWPSEHWLLPDQVPESDRDDAKVARLLPRAPLMNISNAVAVIADASPFRGPHLNPVVALEIGIAVALSVPVFAWAESRPRCDGKIEPTLLVGKMLQRGRLAVKFEGSLYDRSGLKVENLGLVESAALAGNFKSLATSFEAAIDACAAHFARPRPEPSPGAKI